MPRKTLETLGVLVRGKRGKRKLREVADEIGISAATLLRIESGRTPDVPTFGKVCRWLGIEPGEFLGFCKQEPIEPPPLTVSAHLRADQNPRPETISALARMLLLSAKMQHRVAASDSDENP